MTDGRRTGSSDSLLPRRPEDATDARLRAANDAIARRNSSLRGRTTCPECGEPLQPVLYGMPMAEPREQTILAGCCIETDVLLEIACPRCDLRLLHPGSSSEDPEGPGPLDWTPDLESRPFLGPPVPRRRDSTDTVLLEFWDHADLDPSVLAELDRHIRLAGEWQHDHVPRFTDWDLDIRNRIHDDSTSIAAQVSRVDLATDTREVTLTLNTSPVDLPWVEVAATERLGGPPGSMLTVRPARDVARISTRSASSSIDVVDAVLRARRLRRSRFFTCRLCGERRPAEDRCGDGIGHCCCDRVGIIH